MRAQRIASALSRALATLVVVGLASASPAVEFVPNGSFESLFICPYHFSQLAFADAWSSATAGTPDLLACDGFPSGPGGDVGTPDNLPGFEPPYHGDAYAGLIAWKEDDTWREYIQVPLASALEAGRTYRLTFQASLADESAFAVADLGAHVSVDPAVDLDTSVALPLMPQVSHPGVLTQTDGWTAVAGTFVADGGERFLTIGHFTDTANATVVSLSGLLPFAYYYIDSVHIEPICPGPLIDFEPLAVSGPGIGSHGAAYSEDGFDVFHAFPFTIYGDENPYYSGSTAVTVDGNNIFVRESAQTPFDVCSMDLAETDAPPPHFALLDDQGGPIPSQNFVLDEDSPLPERVYPTPLAGVTTLEINPPLSGFYRTAQIDNLCLCPNGTGCACPLAPAAAEVRRFCVEGDSNGIGWSWQLNGQPLVSVPGLPLAASNSDLAGAFAASVRNNGPAGATAVVGGGYYSACFVIAYEPGFSLFVGPQAGPATCPVVDNVNGCPFNPTIYDADVLPPPEGTLQPGPDAFRALPLAPAVGVGLVLAISLAAVGSLRRRGRIRFW